MRRLFGFQDMKAGDYVVWIAGLTDGTGVVDGFSGATALEQLGTTGTMSYSALDAFLGFIPGSIGETSTLAILIGAAILLFTGVASWRTMVSVFAGFVLGDDTTIRQFGFALSTGILLDAFLVRMALMPAVLHLAGERAWWLPRWLDRVVPRVDIEGDHLDRVGGSPAGQPHSVT